MSDISTLQIRVTSEGMAAVEAALARLGVSATVAETRTAKLATATGGLEKAMSRLAVPLLTLVGVGALSRNFYEAARATSAMQAQLLIATSTAKEAAEAYDILQDVTDEKMAFGLEKVGAAFVKLKNTGLDPSQRSLIAYGNLAAAFSTDIDSVAEAVVSAANGQTRGLKQFGVAVEDQGTRLQLTFRGTTTTIKASAEDIQSYMRDLAETNFAGAMDRQNKSFAGSVTKVKEAWENLFEGISDSGFGEAAATQLQRVVLALNNVKDSIDSGEFGARLSVWTDQLSDFNGDVAADLSALTSFVYSTFNAWTESEREAVTRMGITWQAFPTIVTASLRFMRNDFQSFATLAGSIFDNYIAKQTSKFDAAKTVATTYFNHLKASVKDFNATGNFNASEAARPDMAKVTKGALATAIANNASLDAQLNKSADNIAKAWEDANRKIGDDAAASVAKVTAQIAAADKLREEFETRRAQRRADAETGRNDPLSTRQGTVEAGVPGEGTLTGPARAALEQQMEGVRSALNSELENELENYNKRQAILEDFHANTANSDAEYHRRSIQNHYLYEERKTAILKEQASARIAIEKNVRDSAFSTAQGAADLIASLYEKGSAQQMAAFATSKAIAVAQAIVNTELAFTQALAIPGAGIGLATAVRIAGYASVALIAAQAIAQAKGFEHGGMIPAGKDGWVQETGQRETATGPHVPAILVRGPAVVDSVRTTAAGRKPAVKPIVLPDASLEAAPLPRALPFVNVSSELPAAEPAVAQRSFTPVDAPRTPSLFNGQAAPRPAVFEPTRTSAPAPQAAPVAAPVRVVINNNAGPDTKVEATERTDGAGRFVEIVVKQVKASLTSDIAKGGTALVRQFESVYNLRRGSRA